MNPDFLTDEERATIEAADQWQPAHDARLPDAAPLVRPKPLPTMSSELHQQIIASHRRGIGSSRAAMACGVAPPTWGDRLKVYAELCGLLPIEDEPQDGPLYWGTVLEPIVAAEYAKRNPHCELAIPRLHVSVEFPWMLAHCDRITDDGKIVECKASDSSHGWGEPGTDDIPDNYLVQVMHQMVVTGLRVADVPVLFGNRAFAIYTVEYSPRLANLIIEQERHLWERVQRREPPPPDFGIAGTLAIINAINKPIDGVDANLGLDIEERCRRYKELAEQIKALETEQNMEQGQIILAMANAARGRTPGGWRVRRSTVKQKHISYVRPDYVMTGIYKPKGVSQ
jgi:putative phage-type endonuclease